MHLSLTHPFPALDAGLSAFFDLHGLIADANGTPVTVTHSTDLGLSIRCRHGQIAVTVSAPHEVFRALTILRAKGADADYEVRESRAFDTLCAMFDGSQASSLPTEETCKRLLLYLAGMGYNACML